jgi:hypothetical protein
MASSLPAATGRGGFMHKRLQQALDRVQRLLAQAGAGVASPAYSLTSLRLDWEVAVTFSPQMRASAAAVAIALRCCMDADTGEAWMSMPALARACSMSKHTAQNIVAEMVEAGFLLTYRASKGGHDVTRFTPALQKTPLLTLLDGHLGVQEAAPLEPPAGVQETDPLEVQETAIQGGGFMNPDYLSEGPDDLHAGERACDGEPPRSPTQSPLLLIDDGDRVTSARFGDGSVLEVLDAGCHPADPNLRVRFSDGEIRNVPTSRVTLLASAGPTEQGEPDDPFD